MGRFRGNAWRNCVGRFRGNGGRGRAGVLPARGAVEAGLHDGAVEQAERGRELAEGEEGGFVRRERDPHDRRRVIVNLNAGPGLREVGATFAPVVSAWRAVAARYSDDELRLILEFQHQVEQIMRDQLAALRGKSGDGA